MSKIGHIIGLVFALVLLVASKTYLINYPLFSAGFLLIVCLFYIASTVVFGQAFFLYPVLLTGAMSYYLFLYKVGISFIWYPAFSVLLVILLSIAKKIMINKEKLNYAKTLNNGILITAAIFTFWALNFSSEYWAKAPLVFILTFFGYAVFFYLQNHPGNQKKWLNYTWSIYSLAGIFALISIIYPLQIINFLIILAYIFCLILMAIYIYKKTTFLHTFPIFCVASIASIVSMLKAVPYRDILLFVIFVNTICYWFFYKSLKETQRVKQTNTILENLCLGMVKACYILFPVLCWIILLIKGFLPSAVSMVVSAGFAVFFIKLTNPVYKSLFKSLNHYLFLAGAFIVAICYSLILTAGVYIVKSQLLLISPVIMIIFLAAAALFKFKKNSPKYNSMIAISILPVFINTIFLLTSNSINYQYNLVLFFLSVAVFLIFSLFTKSSLIGYAFSILSWYAVYLVCNHNNLTPDVITGIYLAGSVLSLILIYIFRAKHVNLAKVSYFSLMIYSAAAIYFASTNSTLAILAFSILAAVYLLLEKLFFSHKLISIVNMCLGNILAFLAVTIILNTKSITESIYTTLILSVGYYFPFKLYNKEKYAYPAGIFLSIGYLLFLINLCPQEYIILAYLPLPLIFLIYQTNKAALFCGFLSSAAVMSWALGSGLMNSYLLVLSVFIYAVLFFIYSKNRIKFHTAGLVLILITIYFFMRAL